MCLSEGKIAAARIADHVEPHHNDPIKFWKGKLRSLCAHCHESNNRRSECPDKFVTHLRGARTSAGVGAEPYSQRAGDAGKRNK
jgi:hypothetical protein